LVDAPLSVWREGTGIEYRDGLKKKKSKHCFMCILRATKRKENNSLSKKEHPVNKKKRKGIITVYVLHVYKLKDPL